MPTGLGLMTDNHVLLVNGSCEAPQLHGQSFNFSGFTSPMKVNFRASFELGTALAGPVGPNYTLCWAHSPANRPPPRPR